MQYYRFEIITKGSYVEGKQFLVRAKDILQAQQLAKYYFPNKQLRCYGLVDKTSFNISEITIY